MKKVLCMVAAVALLGGCTSVPPLNFVPDTGIEPVVNPQNAELRSITVSAGKPSEQVGEIQVGFSGNVYEASFRDAFKSALEESLLRSRLFRDDAERKVSLIATVLQFETPGMGVNFKTDAVVRYQIIDRASGQTLYEQRIDSTGEVSGTYAFLGAVRQVEARNIAMQNNISNFISDVKNKRIAD